MISLKEDIDKKKEKKRKCVQCYYKILIPRALDWLKRKRNIT